MTARRTSTRRRITVGHYSCFVTSLQNGTTQSRRLSCGKTANWEDRGCQCHCILNGWLLHLRETWQRQMLHARPLKVRVGCGRTTEATHGTYGTCYDYFHVCHGARAATCNMHACRLMMRYACFCRNKPYENTARNASVPSACNPTSWPHPSAKRPWGRDRCAWQQHSLTARLTSCCDQLVGKVFEQKGDQQLDNPTC